MGAIDTNIANKANPSSVQTEDGPKKQNGFSFDKLKDQTDINKTGNKKEKKTLLEKMHKFFNEEEAGKMVLSTLPLAGAVAGVFGLMDVFSSSPEKKNAGTISISIGAAMAGLYAAIKVGMSKARKALDLKNEKLLSTKVNLEKDLLFDEDTRRKLWIAIKQFFGYKSSLQEEDLANANNIGGNMLILYGPPGTGKTAIANGIAEQAGKKIIYVNVNEIKSKWLGESEKNLANIFERAEKEGAWLFFDEADAILQSRGAGKHEHTISLTNTFIQQYNQFKDRTKIILATNTPDNIDPAIKSRGVVVGIKAPPKEVRLEILLQKLKKLGIKEANIDKLKKNHSNELLALIDKYKFAGRDIESGVLRAMHSAEGRIHTEKLENKTPVEEMTIDDLKTSFVEIRKDLEDSKKSALLDLATAA